MDGGVHLCGFRRLLATQGGGAASCDESRADGWNEFLDGHLNKWWPGIAQIRPSTG
jgi:hypothetical protein